ncbi:MAG TPA: sigma-54 dependent transcriptional regulator [Gemmatimonadaceae bacterium]|nr:sigma-54 dependent transcriptional regulator [Gemmatimonadaceae bacterium]
MVQRTEKQTAGAGRILIADDEAAIANGLSAILHDAGYEVEVAADGQKALERLSSERFGVVLADLKMPKLDGIALLKAIRERKIPTEFVMITGQGSTEMAIEAMKEGAADYIEKPLNADRLNKLKVQIPKLLELFAVQVQNQQLSAKLEGLTHYGELSGTSDEMRRVYQVIDAVAPSNASVLILGESGTGKELVARAVHAKSDRAKGPFFALNCAALPKEILENELFGHEKGAFTGSTNEKQGAFELADGGTLFLDEIAEMSPDVQVKLLRALESRQVRRLGGKKEIDVDIRVVAATNRDLEQALTDGEMREDLYYRLAVVELVLPPLRERTDDVRLLAGEFLDRYATQNGKKFTGFSDDAWHWILRYHWPGNVRELKNTVERGVIMARSEQIQLADLMPRHLRQAVDVPSTVTISVGSSMQDVRWQHVLRTFANANGDAARAAKMLGMDPEDVRRELLALLNAPSQSAGPAPVEENGRGTARRASAGGGVAAGPAPSPASDVGRAKTAKRK